MLSEISTDPSFCALGIITIISEGPLGHVYTRQFHQSTGYIWALSLTNLPFNFMTV
ncbi:hypothetical protein EWM64_g5992 [Hericium alpestre]|uniref:Uncharacterized protein n=1 Tax=Hericium alpestre TaxID=135208 RepID=A0A4Y9ZVU8_9AGAM|nr:hypothetical protein EWM64_g5992 [Hericium alpestre]